MLIIRHTKNLRPVAIKNTSRLAQPRFAPQIMHSHFPVLLRETGGLLCPHHLLKPRHEACGLQTQFRVVQYLVHRSALHHGVTQFLQIGSLALILVHIEIAVDERPCLTCLLLRDVGHAGGHRIASRLDVIHMDAVLFLKTRPNRREPDPARRLHEQLVVPVSGMATFLPLSHPVPVFERIDQIGLRDLPAVLLRRDREHPVRRGRVVVPVPASHRLGLISFVQPLPIGGRHLPIRHPVLPAREVALPSTLARKVAIHLTCCNNRVISTFSALFITIPARISM